jgi:hypothetical protein
MIDHIDSNESNGRKSNLRWLCRSCNTRLGAGAARTGRGRRTIQYNPDGGARGPSRPYAAQPSSQPVAREAL